MNCQSVANCFACTSCVLFTLGSVGVIGNNLYYILDKQGHESDEFNINAALVSALGLGALACFVSCCFACCSDDKEIIKPDGDKKDEILLDSYRFVLQDNTIQTKEQANQQFNNIEDPEVRRERQEQLSHEYNSRIKEISKKFLNLTSEVSGYTQALKQAWMYPVNAIACCLRD